MATDLFEALAESKVPSVPEQLDQKIHQRINTRLVAMHFVDLALRGFPLAILFFGQAVVGLIKYSVLGRFDESTKEDDSHTP